MKWCRLDSALEAHTAGNARDMDLLARLEDIDTDLGAFLEGFTFRKTKLAQVTLQLLTVFLVLPFNRLGDESWPDLAERYYR